MIGIPIESTPRSSCQTEAEALDRVSGRDVGRLGTLAEVRKTQRLAV